MEEQQKRKVVKTASIPLIKEELAILERIKKSQGFKNDSDAHRYCIYLFDENQKLQERLSALEIAQVDNNKKMDSLAWRQNSTYETVAKILTILEGK
ncbi:hypothetical protein MAFF241648_21330 [Ralstonia solanacearum]|nr:hypothetical protein MAFF241648_21330 [Ralstonia solanacearum]